MPRPEVLKMITLCKTLNSIDLLGYCTVVGEYCPIRIHHECEGGIDVRPACGRSAAVFIFPTGW